MSRSSVRSAIPADGRAASHRAAVSSGVVDPKMPLTVPDVIWKKRTGNRLTAEEVNFFVESVVDGTANDSQIGAWLMAVFLNGMTDDEIADLTKAMVNSGDRLRWQPEWQNLLVDKHSTGGVGDKVSLVLAPALAACGLKVPMLSGRGLGTTGGTLDKLESIPGFQVALSLTEMTDCLDRVGCFIAGQTDRIATADRILYKHRDVTRTVDSIPLITSSILSKKAAAGAGTLVMDIKVGSGSFLKTEKEAIELSKKLLTISKYLNIEMSAIMSDMDVPIGRYVGNALEVRESVECLRNEESEDVKSLVKKLGGILLHKKGLASSVEEGETRINEVISNGAALDKFKNMIIGQGVTARVATELCNGNFSDVLPTAKFVTRFAAERSGIVGAISAADISQLCWYLGSGRRMPNAPIDYGVGVKILTSIGARVERGDEWIEVHHSQETIDKIAQDLIHRSLTITPDHQQCLKYSRILKVF